MLTNVTFILHNEICQHLKDLHNRVNHRFPNNRFMVLQNHAQANNSFMIKARPMSVKHKSMKTSLKGVSCCTLKIFLKPISFVKIQCVSKNIPNCIKGVLKYSSPFQHIYRVRLEFLHFHHVKQHIPKIECRSKYRIQLSST